MYFTVVTDPASNSSNTLSTAVNWPDSYESDDMLSSQYVQVSPQFHSQSSKVNTRIHTSIPVPSHIQPSFPLLAHISSYGHPIYPFIYTHTSSYVAPPPVVAALHFPYMHVLQNTTHATTAQNVPNSPHISCGTLLHKPILHVSPLWFKHTQAGFLTMEPAITSQMLLPILM